MDTEGKSMNTYVVEVFAGEERIFLKVVRSKTKTGAIKNVIMNYALADYDKVIVRRLWGKRAKEGYFYETPDYFFRYNRQEQPQGLVEVYKKDENGEINKESVDQWTPKQWLSIMEFNLECQEWLLLNQ